MTRPPQDPMPMNLKGRRPNWGKMLVMLLAAAVGGCGSLPLTDTRSSLTMTSQTRPDTRLVGRFDRAWYSVDGDSGLTIVLLDGPIEQPRQAATLRLMWQPKAGRTPLAATATNATIQYLIFTGEGEASGASGGSGGVGVYSGAGFLHPNNRPSHGTLDASLWQATLRLADRSEQFNDRLGPSILSGDISAQRDDAAVAELLRRLAALTTDRLGYPRLVLAPQ